MATTFVEYIGNGSNKNFTVTFPYISQSHVKVTLNGVLLITPTNYEWLSASVIQFVTAPGFGAFIRIARQTPTGVLVDFVDGSTLTETDLDLASSQAIYVAEEGSDAIASSMLIDPADGDWNAQSRPIKNVAAPVDGNDAVNKTYADAIIATAAGSASAAAASASAASGSASAAAGSASAATTSASQADTARIAAEAAEVAAESARDTTLAQVGTATLRANNLSDLVDAGTARTNLGLGALATLASVAFANIASATIATTSEFFSNAASKLVSVTGLWAAAAPVALPATTGTVTLNLNAGLNFTGQLTGNATLANPTNPKNGQRGSIRVQQSSGGNNTLAWGSNWKFANGTVPALTGAASAVDLFEFEVISSTFIAVVPIQDVK
jgi:hypothetical protein